MPNPAISVCAPQADSEPQNLVTAKDRGLFIMHGISSMLCFEEEIPVLLQFKTPIYFLV